eukprot:scaffold34560_cov64-Phaeocystis_antarctica.AAC.5
MLTFSGTNVKDIKATLLVVFCEHRTKGAGAIVSEHCVGSGGRVEPGQGCVMVGPEGPERLAHRASL